MKYILTILLLSVLFNCSAQFLYDYPGKIYYGEVECKRFQERIHKQFLDYESLAEMRDSAIRYCNLYDCSKKCQLYDSSKYYYGRGVYFVNQSEYYCAIVYGVDSIRSILYYKDGEKNDEVKCKCQP